MAICAAARLYHLSTALLLTPDDFAKCLKISLRRARRALEATCPPSLGLMARVWQAFPAVNPQWLLTGQGEMFSPPVSSEEAAVPHNHIGNNYGLSVQIHNGACSCVLNAALQAHLLDKERIISLYESLQPRLSHENAPYPLPPQLGH